MKLKVGKGRILITPEKAEERSQSGLILSPEFGEIKKGIVAAANSKDFWEYGIEIGDKVMYSKMSFVEILVENTKYHLVNSAEILVILSEK
ncbi:MAG: hypothetical protein JETCAE03_32260 [Ignavibacteriaceae bacterium]|jgi:co-chaperonin GroES (HSP10)|nr:MAG: hypothetical protein JETCAE03_32260 [Ignavibacteriaceae bacterium]